MFIGDFDHPKSLIDQEAEADLIMTLYEKGMPLYEQETMLTGSGKEDPRRT